MPDTDPQTLAEILAAINAGEPDTLSDAATAFDSLVQALAQLAVDATKTAGELAGDSGPWKGDAGTAFNDYMTDFGDRTDEGGTEFDSCAPALEDAAQALTTAKEQIQTLAEEAETARANATAENPVDEESFNARAREILAELARQYREAIAQMNGEGGDGEGGDGEGGDGEGGDGEGGDGEGGDGEGGDSEGGDGEGGDGEGGDGEGGDDEECDDEKGDGDGGDGDGGDDGEDDDHPYHIEGDGTDATTHSGGPKKHAVSVDLGNPNAPVVGHRAPHLSTVGGAGFNAHPTSSLVYDPTTGTSTAAPGIGRSVPGTDPTTTLTRYAPGPTVPHTPATTPPAVPAVGSPAGGMPSGMPFMFGGRAGGVGAVAPAQRSELTSAGPIRPRTTEPVVDTEPTGPRARVPISPGSYGGVIGRDEERSAERETWLIGDEDWTEAGATDGAIGRPAASSGGTF